MAKKTQKPKQRAKAAKKAKAAKTTRATSRKVASKPTQRSVQLRRDKGWAIVAQVVAHFGAGYGVQRASEAGGGGGNPQIFQSPDDIQRFAVRLLKSTLKHFVAINWATDLPGRNAACLAAFEHGKLARQQVVAAGGAFLTDSQILTTLVTIQQQLCPPVAGGGRVCDF